MNLTELRSRVRTVVEDSSGAYVTEGEIDDWLNEAQLDLAARLKLLQAELSSTMGAAGTSVANGTIDLPSGFVSAISLRFSTSDVEFVDDDYFWGASDESGSLSNPIARVFNDKIEIYPAAESGTAFKLRYTKKPTDLSAGADIPALPEELHKKMVRYAQAHARLKEGYEGQHDRYMAMYEQGLPPLNPRSRTIPGPMVMTMAPGPWDVAESRHL